MAAQRSGADRSQARGADRAETCRPGAAQTCGRRSRPKPAARSAAVANGRRARRRRLARMLRPAERRHHPGVSAADRELGQAGSTWSRSARCRTAPQAADKPALGTIKLEADTKVALTERLVSFAEDEDRRGQLPDACPRSRCARSPRRSTRRCPTDERVIALDRVLANVDKSAIVAEERRGHQGRSAADLLQQDAGGDRQPRRRADLEPDQGQRPEVRGQHELGSVPARADEHLLPAQQRRVAEGAPTSKGPWTPAGTLPDSFKKLPADENWKDVSANLPGQAGRRVGRAEGVRQPAARRS